MCREEYNVINPEPAEPPRTKRRRRRRLVSRAPLARRSDTWAGGV